MRIKLIITIIICVGLNLLSAQNTSVKIIGKVVESNNNLPVEFATIALLDTTSKQALTGTITAEDGTFTIRTNETNFYLEVSFIGFKTKTITEFEIKNKKIDLETIVIEEDSQALDEVIVRAEKSQLEFKLDKRIFNVGTDLSSSGASALEVLNNIPSVNVNIEGEVSLRGSQGVQILINGKRRQIIEVRQIPGAGIVDVWLLFVKS